jgi:hypothetical protein
MAFLFCKLISFEISRASTGRFGKNRIMNQLRSHAMARSQANMMVRAGLVLLVLAVAAIPSLAAAAEGAGEVVPAHIGAAEICPCTFGPLIADTAIPIDKGRFAIQPLVAFGLTGGDFTGSWRRVSAEGDFYSLSIPVKFSYGLFKNAEVFLVIPYVHNWARNVSEPGPGGERSADFGGLGDINLTFKYMFLEETQTRPAVSGLLAVDFPTGHHSPLNPGHLGTDELGGGAYRFTFGFNLSKWLRPFILYGNLWYSMATTRTASVEDGLRGFELATARYQDFLVFNLAAEYPIGGQGPWVALLEFYSLWGMGPVIGADSQDPHEALLGVLPGIEYVYSDKLAFALGVAIDLAGKNTSYNYTPIFSFTYVF